MTTAHAHLNQAASPAVPAPAPALAHASVAALPSADRNAREQTYDAASWDAALTRFREVHHRFSQTLERYIEATQGTGEYLLNPKTSVVTPSGARIYFSAHENGEGSLYIKAPTVEGQGKPDQVRFRWLGTSGGHDIYLNNVNTHFRIQFGETGETSGGRSYLRRHEGHQLLRDRNPEGVVTYSLEERIRQFDDFRVQEHAFYAEQKTCANASPTHESAAAEHLAPLPRSGFARIQLWLEDVARSIRQEIQALTGNPATFPATKSVESPRQAPAHAEGTETTGAETPPNWDDVPLITHTKPFSWAIIPTLRVADLLEEAATVLEAKMSSPAPAVG